MATFSMEDYLKALLHLEPGEGERVSTSALARWLGVSPPSVTEMLQRMARWNPPLVDYVPRKGACLTEEGRKIALTMLRKHRIIEKFLHDVLRFPWEKVHAEAERLEHAVSDEFIDRLATWMGEPTFDPHGHPIPGPDLLIPALQDQPLLEAPVGVPLRISRVSDRDSGLLRRLKELNLLPGRRIVLLERTPYDHLLHLQMEPDGELVVMGPRIAQAVFVTVEDPALPSSTGMQEEVRHDT